MKKLVFVWWVMIALNSWAQSLQWAKRFGGTGDDFGNEIAVDAIGNVYTTGMFRNTVDFDPGVGTLFLSSAGAYDAYIAKLDALGNLIWAKGVGGASSDGSYSIAIDLYGNVYTIGNFTGTVDFDPGSGIFNLTSAGTNEIFILKLDVAGNFLWAKRIGGTLLDFSYSIAVDAVGNIYTAGWFEGTADFDPGNGTHNLISTGSRDVFVAKLDASGNLVWAKQLGGANADYSYSLAVDVAGMIYVTGTFRDTADFDPGIGIVSFTSSGGHDIFIVKLNSSGDLVWAKQVGGTLDDVSQSIAIDDAGNVFAVGNFGGTADFDPGAGILNLTSAGGDEIFIVKLNSFGNLQWAKRIGGSLNDQSYSVTTAATGDIYLTGYFQRSADFDPNAGVFNLTSSGNLDIFILKLDASGNLRWAISIGGPSGDIGKKIMVDLSENVFLTGWFDFTVDFDPGQNSANLTSLGISDIFILKLAPPVIISGSLFTEMGGPIPGVKIVLNGTNTDSTVTVTDGHYSFNVELGGTYTITPSKNNDVTVNNGVTLSDALLMRRHLLGMGALPSPYKIIAAAEVNADGDTTISTQDILFTRSLILGNITSFPTNRLWQFVSSDYVFPDTQHPFPFDKTRTYTNITTNQTNQNFIGIKLGDVNGSWDSNIP